MANFCKDCFLAGEFLDVEDYIRLHSGEIELEMSDDYEICEGCSVKNPDGSFLGKRVVVSVKRNDGHSNKGRM